MSPSFNDTVGTAHESTSDRSTVDLDEVLLAVREYGEAKYGVGWASGRSAGRKEREYQQHAETAFAKVKRLLKALP